MSELERLRAEVKRLRAEIATLHKERDEISLIARFTDRTAGPTGRDMAVHRIVKVLDKYSPIPEPIEPEETTDVQRPGWRPGWYNRCTRCGRMYQAHLPSLKCPT